MRSSNMFVLRGRTTADIALKQSGDLTYCNFSIAVDRPYRKDKERETDFIYLTAYRGTADFLASYVSKGTMIGVVGEIRTRTWEEDGQKRSRTDFIVDDVEFVGSKQSASDATHAAKQSAPETKTIPVVEDADDDLPF